MTIYPFEIEANIIQCIVIVVFTCWAIIAKRSKMDFTLKLFIWGLIAHMLMNLYWLALILLYRSEEDYASFTASEMAIIAICLIWISMFQTRSKMDLIPQMIKRPIMIVVIAFSIWNGAWWSLWSGHIINNILSVLALGGLMFMTFFSLESNGGFRKQYKLIFYIIVSILVIFEIPAYCSDEQSLMFEFSNGICALAWLGLILLFVLCAIREKQHRTPWFIAANIFALLAQYLTDGYIYSAFMIIESIMIIPMVVHFKSEELGEVHS